MEISEIKSRLDILQVASKLGISIGRNQRAHCPFHDDKNPSLQFSKTKQICTCFSSNCTAGTMDVISLTEKKLNMNTHEALKYLQNMTGEIENGKLRIENEKMKINQTQESIKTRNAEPVGNTEILSKIFNYFCNGFLSRKDNKGRIYLQDRNLDVSKLENLGITLGYNSAQFHHRGRISPGDMKACEAAGLLIPSNNGSVSEFSYTPWASYCVIFPLLDQTGTITGMYGRSTIANTQNKHFYLRNSKGLFYYPGKDTRRLVITESIIDFLSLYQVDQLREQYDFLPIYGTNRLTDQHKQAIGKLGQLQEIIFFLDGDPAGREASAKYSAELHELLPNVKISIVETPEGEDINSLSIGHQPEIFTHLLQNRKPYKIENGELKVENEEKPNNNNFQLTSSPTPQLTNSQSPQLETGNLYKISYSTTVANYFVKGGLPKALDSLKITLEIEHPETKRKSRTKPDLYEDRQVEKVSREAGEKLGIRADLIEQDLNYLTDLLDEYRERTMSAENKEEEPKPVVTAEQQTKCINFLKRKQLIKEFNKLIEQAGITGEENNRIFLFVIATAYKMPDTLHALIQGSSGSGKTYLSKQITDLMPKEDVIRLTRVTESSFYNYGEYEISHKLIVLEDVDGLKEEAEYAFRELQSNGEIISSTSTKDETSGQIRAQIKKVKGPIGSIATTTKGEIYEDNMSRIFLLAVDEGQEQTNRIINYLNRRASGGINKKEEMETKEFIQNCIRLLKPHEIVNPYANKILLPPEAHKIRRLTELFHAFVNQVTLLNQYQRQRTQDGRLITEKEDIEVAIEIMFDSIILKIDELDGSLRQFYEDLKGYVMSRGEEYQGYQFTQREIRQALKISKTQIYRYLTDLMNLEYIIQTGGYANRGFSYKITYWDDIKALRDRIKTYLYNQLEEL